VQDETRPKVSQSSTIDLHEQLGVFPFSSFLISQEFPFPTYSAYFLTRRHVDVVQCPIHKTISRPKAALVPVR